MDNMVLVTMKLGFSERNIGTKMIRTAARYVATHDVSKRLYMMKEVYPHVAKQYGVSTMSAERNMRYAVKRSNHDCMTVGECVSMLSEVVRGLDE